MTLLATLRERLRPTPVPPKCPACHQDTIPLEPSGPPGRWWCAVCAKDFAAVLVDGDWRADLTPLRYKRRR